MVDNNNNSKYEYINEHSIDKHLKCELCKKPFIDPVSTPCQHTFCGQCVEKYLERDSSCPISSCHRTLYSNDLKPLSSGLVTQMLDALPIKCILCQQTRLTRGNFDQHINHMCPQAIVRCLAADINCPWTGPRDELNKHFATCVFRHLKSVFDELIKEIKEQNARIKQLEKQIEHQKTQFDDVQNETTRVSQQHSALEEQVRRVQIENQRQKTETPTFIHQWCTELRTEIVQLQGESTNQMNGIELVNRQCKQFEIQIKQFEVDNQRQMHEIALANQRHNAQLEERIEKFRTENQNQQTDAVTLIDQRCTELLTEIRQLQAENKSQTDGIELIRQQYSQLEAQVKKREAENQSQRDEIVRVNQQHSARLEERIKELHTENQNQQPETITFIDQRCTELQAEISQLQRENKNQTDGIRLVDQQCRQLAVEIKKLEPENQSQRNNPARVHQRHVQPKELTDKLESTDKPFPFNMTTESDSISTLLESNRLIQHRIAKTANEFIRVRDEFLNNNASDISLGIDQHESFIDRFRMIDTELLHARINTNNPALAVCGPNSSGKSAFIQNFLQIGKILPSAAGAITARIVKLTYAPADQSCARIYDRKSSENEDDLVDEISLSGFFNPEPRWKDIEQSLKIHLERPALIDVDSDAFIQWARKRIEIRLPSPILQIGINVYDTPGFLSCNREDFLNENLYTMIKQVHPTILFLYENASITQTDVNCFFELTKVMQSFDRSRIFFVNTKADILNMFNDHRITERPVSPEKFSEILLQSRQLRYDLLCRQKAMGNELVGALPASVDECDCFDICSMPVSARTPFREHLRVMNDACFNRIIQFVVYSELIPMLDLAGSIRSVTEDFFDFIGSTNYYEIKHWDRLRSEALSWSSLFIEALRQELPILAENIHDNILQHFDRLKPEIIQRASRLNRTNDPIQNALENSHHHRIRDYLEQAVNEEIIKVAANETLNNATRTMITLNTHLNSTMSNNRNELVNLARRNVLNEIAVKQLEKKNIFLILIENLKRAPNRVERLTRYVVMRPWSAFYKAFGPSRVASKEEVEFRIFDALDNYSELLNEAARETFAEKRLCIMRERLILKRERYLENLAKWIEQKHQEFMNCIESGYQYVIKSLDTRKQVNFLARQFVGQFARIECQLLAAEDLAKFNGVLPTIHKRLGQGSYFRVDRAEWGHVRGLAVKRLIQPNQDQPYMAYLEAHYHRVTTQLIPEIGIVPLLYLYEHERSIDENSSERELWMFMPEFKQTLRDFLRTNMKILDCQMLLEFAIEITTILSEFHRQKIVHRDLKTSNILMDNNNHCRLADFGTCRENLENRTFIGTPPIPPEVLAQLQQPRTTTYDGSAADIYSLGIILYELLLKTEYHRIQPEDLPNVRLLIKRYVHPTFEYSEYQNLILACLQTNPIDRPTAIQIIERLHALRYQYQSERKSTPDISLCSVCLVCT